jgi:hypothetical protein
LAFSDGACRPGAPCDGRVTAFEEHYRQVAQPFDWTFTRIDLDLVLAKVSEHEPELALAA